MSEFHIFPCPRCGKVPTVKRSEDPAEIDKRYSLKCTTQDCKFGKTIYGATETLCIVNWNTNASDAKLKVIVDPL